MSLEFKTLEKEYNKTIRDIVLFLNIKKRLLTPRKITYLLEENTLAKLKPNRCWIISGISGSGKTTISNFLNTAKFKKLRNITTRPKRSEENNKEYIFISEKKFLLWKNKNLLFDPHKRNGVWHAMLKKDIKKIENKNTLIYLDKSVASSIALSKILPKKINFTFVYILTPTFKELYKRIIKRELLRRKKEGKYLSKKEIFKRFEEEIEDMKKTIKLPYVYIVNDSLKRVKKILNKTIKMSRK